MMFKKAEKARSISKKEYESRLPELRHDLLQAQFALQDAGIPLIIIMSGVEGSGKGEVVNRINSWMDTRGIETHVFRKESEELKKRPFFWRFWKGMPPKGRIGIFFGSWYTRPIIKKTFKRISNQNFDEELKQICFTEQMLTADGMLIAKFWLHISKEEQSIRLKNIESDNRTRWRVTEQDWKYHEHFDRFAVISEQVIRATDTVYAPWHVLDAAQKMYRDISVMEILLRQMNEALERKKSENVDSDGQKIQDTNTGSSQLKQTDLTKKISGNTYTREYERLSHEIEYLAWQCHQKDISSVFVFEGWDAAGKGGTIRRLIAALDAKLYRVIQVSAPTDEENAHHYLWRFWRHLPVDGKITIYDRSWYGRVLVERVEGFADPSEWNRAYDEINNFEKQLADHGTIVKKFWLHVSSDEQLRRFKEREVVNYKKYKLTEDDWRNREKREKYKMAVDDMIDKTDHPHARWHLIPAENKNYARIEIMRIIRDELKKSLNGQI